MRMLPTPFTAEQPENSSQVSIQVQCQVRSTKAATVVPVTRHTRSQYCMQMQQCARLSFMHPSHSNHSHSCSTPASRTWQLSTMATSMIIQEGQELMCNHQLEHQGASMSRHVANCGAITPQHVAFRLPQRLEKPIGPTKATLPAAQASP